MALAVRPPLAPMLAKLTRAIPVGDYFYEPKWDGFRTLVFRDGDALDLRSRNDKPLARYFPEVTSDLLALEEPSFVLDGELVVVHEGALDFAALMGRLHPAASRVERLRHEAPALFVAFDAVAIGNDDLRAVPFERRRARLEALLGRDPPGHLVVTPSTTDLAAAERWLASGGGGIDGVVAKPRGLAYEPGRRTMTKVKRERTADCVVAGVRFLGRTRRVGSLLLGLYDEDGTLVHVGVASQFTDERREELGREVAPLFTTLAGHPWANGFGLGRSPLGRLAGSAGRWVPGMDLDWVPLRPARVCEVAYGILDGRRFRYPARFLRWRPDRDPASCRFDQLAGAPLDAAGELAR